MLLNDHRAKDAWDVKRHSYSCSSAVAETTVPGSSNRVLTRFTHGLYKAPTENRPLIRGGSVSILPNLSSLPHFHPSYRRPPKGAVQWITRPAKKSHKQNQQLAAKITNIPKTPVHNTAMPTDLQSETSRRNGAKSRGPRTPEGKAISSRNATRHGTVCKAIVVEGEDCARFAALLASLRADIEPRNAIEDGIVEDLAACRWRHRRVLAMETACLTREVRRQDPETAAEAPAIRVARAIGSLAAQSRTLELINLYEQRYDRQYTRILRRLSAIRALRDREKTLVQAEKQPLETLE